MMRVPGRMEDGMVLYLHTAEEILTLETPPMNAKPPAGRIRRGGAAALSSTRQSQAPPQATHD